MTANAGAVLEWNGHVIWVDALHTRRVPGFSAVSPALWREMRRVLPPPELLCFTHCHPDHYDFSLVSEARTLWPGAGLFLPRRDFDRQILVSGEELRLSLKGMTLRFLRLPHEAPMYRDVTHYCLLLLGGGSRIFISGDCEVASQALAARLGGEPVDLAVLPFLWLTRRDGRRYLEEVLRPRHVLLCHIPFPEDDANGCRKVVLRAAGLTKLPDVRLLTGPLQRETF